MIMTASGKQLTVNGTRFAALVLLSAVCCPSLALASEGGSAVPQFDPSSFASQVFWLLVSFALLYLLMARVVLPRIGFVVEQRAQKIAQDLDVARTAGAEATSLQNGYEAGMAMARTAAREALATGTAAAQAAQTAALAEQNKQLVARVQQAEDSIAAAKQSALASITPAAQAIAGDVTKKLTGAA
jgi:F-type H+-transporting ATPase subunit b